MPTMLAGSDSVIEKFHYKPKFIDSVADIINRMKVNGHTETIHEEIIKA